MENDIERYHYLEDEIFKLTNRVKELELHVLILYRAVAAAVEELTEANYDIEEINSITQVLDENRHKIELDIDWNHK